ncbi:TerD family protein [Nocardia yunnanensis]|uniref:TerD family protein n=1 Tax=Nocardia yunnanensis TaxID=2382165 RepID=A0A386ZEA6_9NOCA|nr:TerD family protein [Nocardia yunnanensis]AYF75866.1 TerD family protein [Nocardia yunnanensis]
MSVPLLDGDGAPLDCVEWALGWDSLESALGVEVDPGVAVANRFDVNLAALMFSGEQLVDVVFHEHLMSADGAVRHTGDNLTGEGVGANEHILVDLSRISDAVTSIFFTATSYTAMPFTEIPNSYCRVTDPTTLLDIARYTLTGSSDTAFVVGKLTRTPVEWVFAGIGVGAPATHVAEMVPYLAPYLP